MNGWIIIIGSCSLLAACAALFIAARHAVHFEKCRGGRPAHHLPRKIK
jgi:hypothetical protein